jgi:hypothetical protein
MTVRSTPEQEKFIRENTTQLREMISVGLGQIKRGETLDGPAAIEKLRQNLPRRAEKSHWRAGF